ncbi:hypothetical protein SAMN05192529_1025 [Arachidicoccus rhizosphaerae]|uniref:Protein TonB, links inner and outer membranes n=1 Tax=Arachidicoccus rhizosphaerae TaxID=551991 RepID=A0A1H3VZX8_9BACT|nr:hypothetical protein [Arachidicoccus rhizosphaerae]SDZ80231.1 hypothetical protein SAMN05192529_1025 [Arachidicoccus rhizosphaerae]
MESQEKQKNLKALGYTILTCGALAVALIFASWTLPTPPPEVVDNGIEVNLGNSDQGMGDIAPQLPGEPTSDDQTPTDNPPPMVATETQPQEYKEVADSKEDVPVVKTSPKPKEVKKPEPKAVEKSVKKTTEKKVINKTPAPPSPKAVYNGGTNKGTGGNNADSYNGKRNQGIAGGNGDQGKINGNPASDNYNGNGGTGTSGISIRSGLSNRRFVGDRSFTGKFNENAKVAVDIVVNKNGSVTSASVNPRGTTTTNSTILSIAIRKAKELKFNQGTVDAQTGTIVFNFKLNG